MSLVVRSPLLRAGLIVSGLAAAVAAAITSRAAFLMVAVGLLFPVLTSLSQAGRLAASLQGLRHRSVDAVVWGAPLRGREAGALRVESVGAAGAGLLIHLTSPGMVRTLLKVAQPRSWRSADGRVVIGDAAYVQWEGKRLARAEGVPAVEIRTTASSIGEHAPVRS